VFKKMLAHATPDEAQTRDIDFLLAMGEIFTLTVYAQLLLENAEIYAIDSARSLGARAGTPGLGGLVQLSGEK